jgi:thiamine pyrophosphate-dependent acetolactate synthase large subunit-like protein
MKPFPCLEETVSGVVIVGITQPVVKHSYIVRDINKLEFIISEPSP